MREHKFYLHVCNECGRTQVLQTDAEGKKCHKEIPLTHKERKQKADNRDIKLGEAPTTRICRGEWVTSRMYPEEDIFDIHKR